MEVTSENSCRPNKKKLYCILFCFRSIRNRNTENFKNVQENRGNAIRTKRLPVEILYKILTAGTDFCSVSQVKEDNSLQIENLLPSCTDGTVADPCTECVSLQQEVSKTEVMDHEEQYEEFLASDSSDDIANDDIIIIKVEEDNEYTDEDLYAKDEDKENKSKKPTSRNKLNKKAAKPRKYRTHQSMTASHVNDEIKVSLNDSLDLDEVYGHWKTGNDWTMEGNENKDPSISVMNVSVIPGLEYSDNVLTERAAIEQSLPYTLTGDHEQDTKEMVQAVLDGRMTRTQAVRSLKTTFKTFHRRVQEVLGSTLSRKDEQPDNKPFLQAMAAILKATNATPFTTHGGTLRCAYCASSSSRKMPSCNYNTAEDMREHTRDSHPQTSFKNIVACMLPMKKHEILRLDISDLQCKECCIELPSWDQMWSHVETVHAGDLTPAKTRIVPYILTSTLTSITCALCPATFPTYFKLDLHMSQHYPNYVCMSCGKSFVNKCRYNVHLKYAHEDRQEICCDQCGKVYFNRSSLQYHVLACHGGKTCKFCKQKFTSTSSKLKHERKHKYMSSVVCILCSNMFENQASFDAHMKEMHSAKCRNFEFKKPCSCSQCKKMSRAKKYLVKHNEENNVSEYVCMACCATFLSTEGLHSHEKRMHLGEDIFFQCVHCNNKYGAMDYLRKHMRRKHFEDYLKMKEAQGRPYIYKPRTKKIIDEQGGLSQ